MYEDLHGQKVEIVQRRINVGDKHYPCWEETPPGLAGKQGVIEDNSDDAYDTSYPTGYERAHADVKLEDGRIIRSIDLAFLKFIKGEESK